MQWLETEINSQRVSVGQKLPGERHLADQLGVSRTAVREALRMMEAMGVVRSRTGSGPNAGTVIIAEPAEAFGSTLRMHLATNSFSAADVVETRVLLESWAVTHIDPSSQSLVEAERLLEAMEDPTLDTHQFLDLDADFHIALTASAGNPLVTTMLRSIRSAIRQYTSDIAVTMNVGDEMFVRLRREHALIKDAAIEGSPEAAKLVHAHVHGYFQTASSR